MFFNPISSILYFNNVHTLETRDNDFIFFEFPPTIHIYQSIIKVNKSFSCAHPKYTPAISGILKYTLGSKMVMNNISLLLYIISILSVLYLGPLSISSVQAQSGHGLVITPSVQWSQNLEGVFSYCVYEGTVTLDSVNDPQAFCMNPTSDSNIENMQSLVDDQIEIYQLNQITTPAGLFKDGAPYSVCATFTPQSQDAGFNTAENCQQFTNKKGSHPEEPFINLDEGVLFTNNQ